MQNGLMLPINRLFFPYFYFCSALLKRSFPGYMKQNKTICTHTYRNANDVLYISPQERASMLTTYAICGFSSFGTLAIFVGVWATVVPSRATEMSRLIPRVYVNTNLSCFLTACIAGTKPSQLVYSVLSQIM